MTEQLYGFVHYAGRDYQMPVEHVEDVRDILEGIDLLGGSHLFRVGGIAGDDIVRFWITKATPIVLIFPNGYERAEDREDYVVRHLQTEARYRLDLPLDGSGDSATARIGDSA